MSKQWESGFVNRRTKAVALMGLVAVCAAIIGQGCPSLSPAPNPNSGLTGDYVGAERCFTCHSRTHDEWMLTRHNQAYNDLVQLGQETNGVCLTCHSTGYGKPGGFQSTATTLDLANVGCEACHGAAGPHVRDVTNRALRPPVSISADWCSACHNGFHHDTYSQWKSSRHATVTETVAEELAAGTVATSCGICHSGDVRQARFVENRTITDAFLSGVEPDHQNAVTCAVCHDPHATTGNALNPPAAHDRQLRYPQVTYPEPANLAAQTTDPNRFNLCGQCHHDRGRDWTTNSRGPHHSVQANMFVGEMVTPSGQSPLVANQNTTHRFVQKQCVTCHMQRQEPINDVPAEAGNLQLTHTFSVDSFVGCVASGCHPTEQAAEADLIALKAEVQGRLDAIAARMGPASTWQFSAEGGPAASAQSAIPVEIRKARWLWAYVIADGSLGTHNPPYTRSILREAETLLTAAGK